MCGSIRRRAVFPDLLYAENPDTLGIVNMPRPLRHIAHVSPNRRRHTRPSPWALLAVVLAVLVCLGCNPPDYGEGVGSLDDGALLVDMGPDDEYVSSDGGYTWQPLYTWESGERRWAPNFDEHWEDAVRWGEAEVETPRGRYAVEENDPESFKLLLDVRIVRIDGDAKNVVYAPAHLQKAADRRFRDRQHAFYNSLPLTAPKNLVYHAPSGNIVAVLGLEEVVVGDAEDNWRPLLAEVGKRPVDVSMLNKISFAVSKALPAAISIAIATAAAALSLAEWSRDGRTASNAFFSMLFASIRGLLILIALIVIEVYFFGISIFSVQSYILNALVALLGAVGVWRKGHPWFKVSSIIASAAVPMIVFVAILGFFDSYGLREEHNLGNILAIFTLLSVSVAGAVVIWLKTRALVGAMNLMVAYVCSIVSLVAVQSYTSSGAIGVDLSLALALASFVCGIMAIICFAPSFLRQLHIVFAALIGMAALVALAFAIDAALGFYIWPAKVCAIILVLAVTRSLFRYLRASQHSSLSQINLFAPLR